MNKVWLNNESLVKLGSITLTKYFKEIFFAVQLIKIAEMLLNFPLSISPKMYHQRLDFIYVLYFLKSIWKK